MAASTESGHRLQLTSSLLLTPSQNLISKYASSNKLPLSQVSVKSQLSQTQGSALTRGLSSVSEKTGALTSSSGSSLSSKSQLSSGAGTMPGSKSGLTMSGKLTSKSLSVKSTMPLTSLLTASTTPNRGVGRSGLLLTPPEGSSKQSSAHSYSSTTSNTRSSLRSSQLVSSQPLTSLSGKTSSMQPLTSLGSKTSSTLSSQPLTSLSLGSKISSTLSSQPLTSLGSKTSSALSSQPLGSKTSSMLSSQPLTSLGSKTSSMLSSQPLTSLGSKTSSTLSGKPLATLSGKTTSMLSSKPLATLSGTSSTLSSKPLAMLSGSSTFSSKLTVKPSVTTPSLTSSRPLQGTAETQDTESVSANPAVAKPVTDNTEGAPKYDFSSSAHPKATKKKLFVSPELDASVQAPPSPAVDIIGTKVTLLNAVATSLLCSPDFRNPKDPTHKTLSSLGEKLSHYDPEFLLKLALYTRVSLNIRITANFLLALAAKLPACRPYLRKYFSATVKLPSDWIEVAEIYQAFQDEHIKSGAIPTALRKVMGSKFTEFDAYQLGKYNKDSSKKKKSSNKPAKPDKGKSKSEKERKEEYYASFPPLKESDSDSDTDSSVVLSESENKEEIERLSFTLKQLIRKIHISEPVEYVMCLIGKKYPEDPEAFRKTRLPGTWQQDRAGKRMKLPTPETWETQVSTKGNKARTWEDLIDHNKLPFMAMLRNIRNLILAGVSSKHHKWVIRKLNDEHAVVNSKQFPFRFFSAYEVLEGLEKMANGEAPPTKPWGDKKKKKKAKPKEIPEIDKDLLQKYKAALDSALKIATCYNVKPISGSTLILCNAGSNMVRPCTAARGLGKPRKVVEVGLLLGLMCKYSCEKSTMLIYGHDSFTEVDLEEGTILNNMERVMKAASNLSTQEGVLPLPFLMEMLVDRRRVDNIVLLTDAMKLDDQQGRDVMDFLKKYRHFVNPDLLFVSVDLSGKSSGVSSTIIPEHPNDIYLAGYSDQILRFIAERGDTGQLTYVENIDKAFNLTGIKLPSLAESALTDEEAQLPSLSSEKMLLSTSQGQKWRTVRVFISSTFRDMHGERDLLTRFVFPELRARAYSRQIHVYEVDLRWGVTEQDARSHRAMEICLQEISRSHYFIGLLGQRYGWIQDEYQFPDTPEFDWLKEYPQRKSITEVEMYHAALRDPDKAVNKAFFYFRDLSSVQKVPLSHRADFVSESEEAREKIKALKSNIFESGLEVYDNYPCHWLGEIQDKPMMGGLESFGERVLHSLWNAIQRDYPEEGMEEDPILQAAAQHTAFQDSRASSFIGRRELLKKARTALDSPDSKLVLVTGKPGCGKSAFMAAIAQEHTAIAHSRASVDLIISHFIGAAPGSANIALVLTRLCHEMKRRFEVSRDIPDDYTDLVREWQGFLEDSATNLGTGSGKIVVLIDGIDLFEEKHNARSLDWLPDKIPDKVVLVLSGVEGGTGVSKLRTRKPPPSEIAVGALDMFDKAEMVRKKLAKHRKSLDESPFNNQLKLLLTKKEATNPLFLHLACEELRVFGVFEEVTSFLKKLPTTISNLLQDILQRLESEHGTEILSTAMILLTLVRNGLLEYELTSVLQLALRELYPERESEGNLPAMVTSKLLRSLQTFLQPTGQENQDRLALAHRDIEKAVQLRYTRGAASKKESQLHRLLATFFRAEADPDGDNSFKGNSSRAFTELPYHLMQAAAWRELEELLCDINYIIAKSQLGLAQQLLEDFSPATTGLTAARSRDLFKFLQQPTVQQYKSFVSRNLHVLLKTPSLALQQALNEPITSVVAAASSAVWQGKPTSMMLWLNKPSAVDPCQMNISSQTAVLCVDVAPNSSSFVAGFKNGAVKVYQVATGKELHTFVGHAAGVSGVCFVGSNSVCSASRDTTLSLWDTTKGIRLATLKGHTRGVHACSADRVGKNIVSVSWDTSIKVWEGRSGKLQATLKTPGQRNTPINCVSFHPEGQLVVVGSWDAILRIWDTFNQKRVKSLKGHKSSIQACSYAPSGRHVVSAALDGEVRVWSTRHGIAVGSIMGHHSPVKGLAFTPNGQFLGTASSDRAVKVWSGSLGQPVASAGSVDLGPVHQLAFHADTQSVSVGYHDGHIRQFNIHTGIEVAPPVRPHSAPVVGLAHLDKLHMAAFADGTMKVCDLASLPTSVQLKGHTAPITCATWTGKGLASASEDFSILMWPYSIQDYSRMLTHKSPPVHVSRKKRGKTQPSVAPAQDARELTVEPKAVITSEHTGKITSLSFSSDGKKLAAASHDQSISIWSCYTHKLVKRLQSCHKDWITACTYSNTAHGVLITGSTDCTLKVWDLDTEKEKATLKGHTSAVSSVAMLQDCVVSGAVDGSVKVWTRKGVEITTMYCHKQPVNACFLHVPGKTVDLSTSWADRDDEEALTKPEMKLDEILVLTGSDDGTMGVWKPFLPNQITSLVGHSDQVLSVSATLNNQFITSSSDGSIRVWNPDLPSSPVGPLALKHQTVGHTGPVSTISAQSVGEDLIYVASGGRDGYVKVWEMTANSVRQLHQMKTPIRAVNDICLTTVHSRSKSGRLAAVGDSGEMVYYEFYQKEVPKLIAKIPLQPQPASKLVLLPDKKTMVAGSWSNKVMAINSSKKTSTTMGEHKGWVMDLITAQQTIYSLGLDSSLYSWSLPTENSPSPAPTKTSLKLKMKAEEDTTWPLALCEVWGTQYLALADSGGKVHLWHRKTWRIDLSKKLHAKQVNVLCPVSKSCFMTGSDDSTVKVWEVEGPGSSVHLTQVGQFYCQACVTAITKVNEEKTSGKPMFVVGDSLGHMSLLQWIPKKND